MNLAPHLVRYLLPVEEEADEAKNNKSQDDDHHDDTHDNEDRVQGNRFLLHFLK
jgi:hypothetical protein